MDSDLRQNVINRRSSQLDANSQAEWTRVQWVMQNEGSRQPAGDLASLGGVKEANILTQEGVKQVGAYPEVQAGHAQSEEAATHPCEHCTPKCYPHELQCGLLEHLAVRLYGCVVYDLASEVGH